MENLRVRDGSEEVRVEIVGFLSEHVAEDLDRTWKDSQSNLFWRRFVVDISGLTGYDLEGHELLHTLHRHGAIFVAPTPSSLDFLQEISSGKLMRPVPAAIRRSAERSVSPRPRHRAGLGTYESNARYR
jgi:hypothetical protein